jgi:GTPase SAR1 family protein
MSHRNPEASPTLKILVLGSPGVGKSSVVRRHVHGVFTHAHTRTVGCDLSVRVWTAAEARQALGGQQVLGHFKSFFKKNISAFFRQNRIG